ncbi:translation regulator GCD7 [Teratosphaeria nubilosa]|uniref:Translation initiation factor eIF2B subunit beta n=1 Tax=Teratosphaeria nubilosa TaxID=161662 RepID=A0A6G1LEQ6_9PEZI|nr:translation regulator GCD7 [Teratosphaeria nubilosa]
MTAPTGRPVPGLASFLKSLKENDIDSSIELFISMLKRRQIKNSRPCAIATAHLLLRVVGSERTRDAQTLIDRILSVGQRLVSAQPREMAVGNIVRRILGVVREVAEEDEGPGESETSDTTPSTPIPGETLQRPSLPTHMSEISPLHHGAALPQDMQLRAQAVTPLPQANATDAFLQRPAIGSTTTSYAGQAPPMTSLFSILQHPQGRAPLATPSACTQSPKISPGKPQDGEVKEKLDIKAEVCNGIQELQEELEIVDTQIAESALDHIHNNEVILTHTSSQTVQKFLMAAAKKKTMKFTVVVAEAYPNDHEDTHATVVNGGKRGGHGDEDADERWKPLTDMGITVILIPDSAVFALMSRINKVILAPHTVLANGSLIAAAGASTIAQTAKYHHVPVVVLSGVYKLSPVYPFDTAELIEHGDPGKVVGYEEGEFIDKVDVRNPVYDFVDSELIDLYITNLGGHAPSYLYRIVADHYRVEDIDLMGAR